MHNEPGDKASPSPTTSRADSEDWQAYVRLNLGRHDRRLTAFEKKLTALGAKLDANSAATERVETSTRGIVETMASWNGAMKTIGAIGTALRPLTFILAFFTALVGLWAALKQGWSTWNGK